MDDVTIIKTDWADRIPIELFLEVASTTPHGLGKDPRFADLQQDMRAAVPVPGDDWVHDIEVLIEPDSGVHQAYRRHSHTEWTSLFYADPAGTPTHVVANGREARIQPDPGDIVVIPPNLDHWVANHRGDRPRLSFAMLVQVPGVPSRFDHV